MSIDLKANIEIPDLWYDFYSRLLPGIPFVAAVRWFCLGYTNLPTLDEMMALLVLGYLSALFVQPIGSLITYGLEDYVLEREGLGSNFLRDLKHKAPSGSKQPSILSKMHGEVSFFTQLAVLSVLFLIALEAASNPARIVWVFPGVSTIFGLAVALRMIDRAKQVKKSWDAG